LSRPFAIVLVLKQLLRGEEVRVAAPARERDRDVTLSDTRRRFYEEDARARGIVFRLVDRVGEGGEQTRLLGARRERGREVREKVRARHATL
jgi:hypothetical protein